MDRLQKLLRHTTAVGECLEWTRCFNSDGYPRAGIDGNCNGKVHRKVFELVNGFAPLVVRHSCDNIRCINPAHLLAGDPTSNMKDRSDRGRTHGHVSYDERRKILSLRAEGKTYRYISNILDIKPKRAEYVCLSFGG